jgi:hypothetical protein
MFDTSKVDAKSKVIKSAPFGQGRWTVLFYAQSGHEQFCSLYLNAEPLPHERLHPLLASAPPSSDARSREGSQSASAKSKSDGGLEDRWERKGSFKFTFNIQTIEDRTTLGTKEAHDHAFSHKTSNWGWAQFAKRDHVYYKNPDVVREDGFLITVTITSSAEKPKPAEPLSYAVPPVLVQAMGSLLDDPEHSDVVFLLHPSRRRASRGRPEVRKVYAIRKILAARSEYFKLMFEGGFQEAEAEDTSDEEGSEAVTGRSAQLQNAPAHPSRSHHAAARAGQLSVYGEVASPYEDAEVDGTISPDDEIDDLEGPFFEDSDEDFDDDEHYASVPSSRHTAADHRIRNLSDSGHNTPNEDAGADLYTSDLTDDEAEQRSKKTLEGADDTTDRITNNRTPSELIGEARTSIANQSPEANDAINATGQASAVLHTSVSKPRSKRERLPTVEGISINDDHLDPISQTSFTDKRSATPTREPDRRKRRKVNVLDSAYLTFKALLFFLYTDTVEFAPLTSSFLPADITVANDYGNTSISSAAGTETGRGSNKPTGNFAKEMAKAHRKRRATIEHYRERNPDKPTPCSAKAMYRLADKLDIPDLKRRAQDHIQMSLTVHNIVWEVFSGFNTQYPEIRRMETDFLLKHWPQVKRSSAMKSIFLRSSAHPGLAEVWPHLLEFLEYRQPDVDETEDQAATY